MPGNSNTQAAHTPANKLLAFFAAMRNLLQFLSGEFAWSGFPQAIKGSPSAIAMPPIWQGLSHWKT
jgi:hypothetical protein